MSDPEAFEPDLLHLFKNQLAIIVSFSELLLAELPESTVRTDIGEIHKAAAAAIALVPQLTRHYRQ